MLKPTIFISTLLLLQPVFAAETKLNVDKTSGKIEYQISETLPKGDYKIWNVTKDTDVGIEIHKKSASDASGKIAINKNSVDDKFALLDADGFTVYTLEVEAPKQTTAAVAPVIAPIAEKPELKTEPVPEVKVAEKEIAKEAVKEEVIPQIVPETPTTPTILAEDVPMDSLSGDDEVISTPTVESKNIVQVKAENEAKITDTEMPSKKN